MASVFKLRRNAVDVNLASAIDAGWRARRWNPRVAAATGNRMPPPITETVTFLVDEDTHDNLSTAFQTLDNYRWLAREYIQDRTQEHPVWWHVKMNNETGERRSLVYDLGLQWQSDQADANGQWSCQSRALMRANIVRGPFWERTTAAATGVGTGLSVLGGAFDYTAGGGADVVGDAPARINHLLLYDGPATILSEGWFGFRSANKRGALANFQPLWELESGVAGTDTALFADPTASPGGGGNTCMRCTFATVTGWGNATQYRSYVSSDHIVAGNEDDNFGRFVVLLRAKMTAGTAEVQLKTSYQGMTGLVEGPIVEVADIVGWHMYNIGSVTVPLRNLHALPAAVYAATYDDTRFHLFARRTSGAGNLDMDCLVFIPADELFLYVDDGYIDATHDTSIGQSPENIWVAIAVNDTLNEFHRMSVISPSGFGVPIGDGRMYGCLATGGGRNVITETYSVSLSLFPRWYNLRGAE